MGGMDVYMHVVYIDVGQTVSLCMYVIISSMRTFVNTIMLISLQWSQLYFRNDIFGLWITRFLPVITSFDILDNHVLSPCLSLQYLCQIENKRSNCFLKEKYSKMVFDCNIKDSLFSQNGYSMGSWCKDCLDCSLVTEIWRDDLTPDFLLFSLHLLLLLYIIVLWILYKLLRNTVSFFFRVFYLIYFYLHFKWCLLYTSPSPRD